MHSTVTKTSGLRIANLGSVTNPNSIHGIYPYRGKISAIDAAGIIKQLQPATLLDPFCGSGTIVYEAARNNFPAIGIDNNPLAIWIAKGKMGSLKLDSEYVVEALTIVEQARKLKRTREISHLVKKAFHTETAYEAFSLFNYFDEMSDYLRACLLGATALTARACNGYMWTSSSVGKDIQPKDYINFYDKFLHKVNKHAYPSEQRVDYQIHSYDSRKITDLLPPKSVKYVFTSPPYFDSLDYTAYYGQIVYDILGHDRTEVKKGLIQTASAYEEDMKKVLDELVKVTTDDALIIFVVGDKKIKDKIINGGEFFSNLLHHKPNTVIERGYTGSSSQIFDKLNKTERKEQIVIWDKSTWY